MVPNMKMLADSQFSTRLCIFDIQYICFFFVVEIKLAISNITNPWRYSLHLPYLMLTHALFICIEIIMFPSLWEPMQLCFQDVTSEYERINIVSRKRMWLNSCTLIPYKQTQTQLYCRRDKMTLTRCELSQAQSTCVTNPQYKYRYISDKTNLIFKR